VSETVRERRRFLQERLAALAERVQATERQKEIAALAERVRAGSPLGPVPTDEEWGLLLPDEQADLLPAYYIKVRAELAVINGQGADARRGGRLAEWLDGPVPKIAGLGSAVTAIAQFAGTHGVEALRALGLAYMEPRDGPGRIEEL
jgi:hypothetical protein